MVAPFLGLFLALTTFTPQIAFRYTLEWVEITALEIKSENHIQKNISEEDLYGTWITFAKTNNKYRSNPINARKDSYSFNKDSSIEIVLNNKIIHGVWSLSDKNTVSLTYKNTEKLYRITHFEDGLIILADSNVYLSLVRKK